MDRDPAPRPLSGVDLAFLRAARAWGGSSAPDLWACVPAERRSTLRWAWENQKAGDPAEALDHLRREVAAQARPDPARVHPSWWVRALKEEPASIQRAVILGLPVDLAETIREGLNLSADDLRPDRPGHPEALQIVAALWSVQLVGDLAERGDDPPVIAALTRFDAPTVARLLQTTGLAKWALTNRPTPALDRHDLGRFAHFRTQIADSDPRFAQIASGDVENLPTTDRHSVARAGMITFARLLLAADPYRARWALQHLPYPTARALRTLMGPAGRKAPMMVRWETEVLRASWTRLHQEGRLTDPWGNPL